MNDGWTYYDRIQPEDEGKTVVSFYAKRYPHTPEAEWRGHIHSEEITLDGNPTEAEAILAAGQELA